jgi:hypothetical protein
MSGGIGSDPPRYVNRPSVLRCWNVGNSGIVCVGPMRNATLAGCPGTNS